MTVRSIKKEERLDLRTSQEADSAELGNWLAVEMKNGEDSRDARILHLSDLQVLVSPVETENLPFIRKVGLLTASALPS